MYTLNEYWPMVKELIYSANILFVEFMVLVIIWLGLTHRENKHLNKKKGWK